jgi:creatinine amidohydrolase
MKHRFWSEYTARDFAKLDHENLIAVLPVGAVEQHGPHLPLSVDQAIVDGLVESAVGRLPDDIPVLFLPTMPIGKSNEHSEWPGTLTFSSQTLMAMWTEIGDCVAAAGVRKMVFLNSHGGQIAPMDIVARDLRVKHKMLTVAASWFGMGMPDGVFSEVENRFGIHAGDMETSVMLALHPEHVQMEHARNFHPAIANIAHENIHLGLSIAGKLGWQAQDMNPAGAGGNAAAATAEKGAQVIEYAADQMVKLFAEVHRMPLSFLDNAADPDAFA